MTNLLHLRPKPENLEEIHILISNRILALVLHYGLEHFLNTSQDVNCSQYGPDSKALSIDRALPRHIKNLVACYGAGSVASLVRVMYQKDVIRMKQEKSIEIYKRYK